MSPPLLPALRVRIRAREWTGLSQTEGERRRKPPEQGGGEDAWQLWKGAGFGAVDG